MQEIVGVHSRRVVLYVFSSIVVLTFSVWPCYAAPYEGSQGEVTNWPSSTGTASTQTTHEGNTGDTALTQSDSKAAGAAISPSNIAKTNGDNLQGIGQSLRVFIVLALFFMLACLAVLISMAFLRSSKTTRETKDEGANPSTMHTYGLRLMDSTDKRSEIKRLESRIASLEEEKSRLERERSSLVARRDAHEEHLMNQLQSLQREKAQLKAGLEDRERTVLRLTELNQKYEARFQELDTSMAKPLMATIEVCVRLHGIVDALAGAWRNAIVNDGAQEEYRIRLYHPLRLLDEVPTSDISGGRARLREWIRELDAFYKRRYTAYSPLVAAFRSGRSDNFNATLVTATFEHCVQSVFDSVFIAMEELRVVPERLRSKMDIETAKVHERLSGQVGNAQRELRSALAEMDIYPISLRLLSPLRELESASRYLTPPRTSTLSLRQQFPGLSLEPQGSVVTEIFRWAYLDREDRLLGNRKALLYLSG